MEGFRLLLNKKTLLRGRVDYEKGIRICET